MASDSPHTVLPLLLRPEDSTQAAEPAVTASINGWRPPSDAHRRQLLFEADKDERLTHRLFRFPAKFHAPVVRELIGAYTQRGDRVLDPFCGSGTALVEASVAGRNAVGFDVDPLSVFLSRAKSQRASTEKVRAGAESLLARVGELARSPDEYRRLMHDDLDQAEYAEELGDLDVPAIPNLNHWFRRYVIVDLARLREAINELAVGSPVRDLLRVTFAATIRLASNADPVPVSGLERTKHMLQRDKEGRLVDPFSIFRRRLRMALNDIQAYQEARDDSAMCRASRADATRKLPLKPGESIQATLTSPPYHGAVDYYRRHQLEMFWLGLTRTQADRLKLLDSYLGRPHVPQRHPFVARGDLSQWPSLRSSEREIREQAPQRADEFRHYCVGMGRALARLADVLPADGPAIFVLGHSRWKGASIDTSSLFTVLAGSAFNLEEELWYPVRNRHMSYGRRNGANIDREYVLVLRRCRDGAAGHRIS